MARIRTIKPGFFRHEELFQAEVETGLPLRVAFAGLWCCADREGRFRWKPSELKLDVLPFDAVDFGRVLDALVTRGFLVRYAWRGREYGVIPTFTDHQIINNREAPSSLPGPNDPEAIICEGDQSLTDSSVTRGSRVAHASTTRHGVDKGEEEKEEEEEKERKKSNARSRAAGDGVFTLPDWIPVDRWKAFVAMRRKIRAPLTDHAVQLAVRELERLREAGHDPGAVLDQSTLNSWKGLFPIKGSGGTSPPGRPAGRGPATGYAADARGDLDDWTRGQLSGDEGEEGGA